MSSAAIALLVLAALMLAAWRGLLRLDRSVPLPNAPMLTWGAAGMLAGLAWDARGATLSLAAASCASSHDVLAMLRFHWSTLPAMDLCMVAGSVVGMGAMGRGVSVARSTAARQAGCDTAVRHVAGDVARGVALRAGCCAAMFGGMNLGVVGAQQMIGVVPAYASAPAMRLAVMVAGMLAGMAWGMVAFAALERAGPVLRRTLLVRA